MRSPTASRDPLSCAWRPYGVACTHCDADYILRAPTDALPSIVAYTVRPIDTRDRAKTLQVTRSDMERYYRVEKKKRPRGTHVPRGRAVPGARLDLARLLPAGGF